MESMESNCGSSPDLGQPLKEYHHANQTRHITPLLVAGAAAAAIAAAPTAMAAPAADPAAAQQSCADTGGGGTECQSPGNVQINDSPGPVQYSPQYPYWEGGYRGYGRDGRHR